MNYEFRPLSAPDIFPMCKIIGKIGVNEISSCFEKDTIMRAMSSTDEASARIVGMSMMLEIVNVVVKNLPACESEIYSFMANVTGQTVKEVKSMGMVEFFEMLTDFIMRDEFKDFFKVASKFVK